MSLCDLLLADVPMSAPIQRKPVKRSRRASQQASAPTPTAPKTSTPPSSSAPPTNVEHSSWPPSSHHRHHTRLIDLHYPLTAPIPAHVLNSLDHFDHISLDTPVSDNHRKLSPKKGCLKPSKPSEQEKWDGLSNKKKLDMVFDRIAEITGTSQDEVEVDDMLEIMDERPSHMTSKTSSHHHSPPLLSHAPQNAQSAHPARGRKRFRCSDEDANVVKNRPLSRGNTKTPGFGDHEEGWRPAPSPVTFSGAQVIYGIILADSIGPIPEFRETKVSFAPDSQEWFIWRTSRPLSAREMRRHRRTFQNPWDRELKRYDTRKQWHNNRRTFKYRSVRDKFVDMTIDNANTPVEIEIATIMLDGLHEKCQAGPVYVETARAEMAYVVDTLRLEERTNRDSKIGVADSGMSFFDPERARLEEAARLAAGAPSGSDLPRPVERPKSVNEWAYSNTTPSDEEMAEMRRAYLDEAASALRADAPIPTPSTAPYTAEASVLKLDASGLSIGLNVYPQPSAPLQIICSSKPPEGSSISDGSFSVRAHAQESDATGVYINLNIHPNPTVPIQLNLSQNPPHSSSPLSPRPALIFANPSPPTFTQPALPPPPAPSSSMEQALLPSDPNYCPRFIPSSPPSSIALAQPVTRSQLPSPPWTDPQPPPPQQPTAKTKIIKSIYTSDRRSVDNSDDFLNNLPRDQGAHKELDGDDNRWEDMSDGDSCVTSDIDFASCWDDMGDIDVRGGWDD